MIDHAKDCTGYPCICRSMIISRRVGAQRHYYCSICRGPMFREDGYFVHVENGAGYCPDELEDSEQWE